jgi:RNA polymerase sigma-70 factor (ECF subfamily)
MRISSEPRTAVLEPLGRLSDSIANSIQRPNVNQEAFRVFYNRTSRPLRAYLLRMSGRVDVADDLLQESYCRFLAASLPEMDEGQSRSYLFKVATNLLHDRWRRKEIPDNIDSARQSCEDDRETRIDVRRAFDRLKPRERQLLWLAHVEGFDHKEIARLTGVKVASVRVLLFRARGELANALRERSRMGSGV